MLMDIQAQISTVASKMDSFTHAYAEGKAAQLVKAAQDEKHFSEIKGELAFKVDKREVKPILALNSILLNWRLAFMILILLSSLGLISITGDWLRHFLKVIP